VSKRVAINKAECFVVLAISCVDNNTQYIVKKNETGMHCYKILLYFICHIYIYIYTHSNTRTVAMFVLANVQTMFHTVSVYYVSPHTILNAYCNNLLVTTVETKYKYRFHALAVIVLQSTRM
jgi:hypothetical protein